MPVICVSVSSFSMPLNLTTQMNDEANLVCINFSSIANVDHEVVVVSWSSHKFRITLVLSFIFVNSLEFVCRLINFKYIWDVRILISFIGHQQQKDSHKSLIVNERNITFRVKHGARRKLKFCVIWKGYPNCSLESKQLPFSRNIETRQLVYEVIRNPKSN